jgi:2-methylisocitrate lyase-like PEP mutase family enzyme
VSQEEKGSAFRALHQGEPFVIPNPWDAGSAKVLASLGFEALATTSGGFAFTVGKLDGGVTLGQVIDQTRAIAGATDLPVSVDLENGHGHSPQEAARAIAQAAEAGAVGGSIEDWDREGAIYELDHATERIAAAREAADALGFPFTLTARAENFLHDKPDLDDTIARLQAYERAGADVIYAPGLASTEQIRAISEATAKPLNVLARSGLSMREMVEAGAQRVSVGSRFLWVAVAAMVSAAEAIRDSGDFSQLAVRVHPDEWLG